MFPKMEDKRPPVTRGAIENFERASGLTLPKSYKEFLLETNGGAPTYDSFPVHGMADRKFETVQSFAGIGVPIPTTELAWGYDLYSGGIPSGILPIAGNGGGDWICLDLRDGQERVALWDFRHHWGTGEWREQDLYHIADSFEGFLKLLQPNPY